MRSIRNPRLVGVIVGVAVAATLTACSAARDGDASNLSATSPLPVIDVPGSRAHLYGTLGEVAAVSSALVVASPTGMQSARALPAAHGGTPISAPTTYVQMKVSTVVSGEVNSEVIDVVSPGVDEATQKPALLTGGPYLMYLTPAMYDAGAPAGGYAISGGPAGVYGATGVDGEFGRIDAGSPSLPARILDLSSLPAVTHTAQELVEQGPR